MTCETHEKTAELVDESTSTSTSSASSTFPFPLPHLPPSIACPPPRHKKGLDVSTWITLNHTSTSHLLPDWPSKNETDCHWLKGWGAFFSTINMGYHGFLRNWFKGQKYEKKKTTFRTPRHLQSRAAPLFCFSPWKKKECEDVKMKRSFLIFSWWIRKKRGGLPFFQRISQPAPATHQNYPSMGAIIRKRSSTFSQILNKDISKLSEILFSTYFKTWNMKIYIYNIDI